ncbi:unnamed protein product, partial [Prorocentrum cordatum]
TFMAQLKDIQTLLDTGFGKLRQDLKGDIMREMEQLLDTKLEARLKQHHDELMEEIRKLQERTTALESRADAGGVGSKRARSEGPGYRATRIDDDSDNKVLVLKGFPCPMWSKTLVKHAETVFQSLSPNTPLPQIRAASNTKHARLIFNDSASAKAILEESIRAGPRITIGSESIPLSLQWDRSPDERVRGWVISQLWQKLEQHMTTKGLHGQVGCRRGKGEVFVDVGGMGQLITIFTVLEDGVSTRVHTNGLDKVELSPETAASMASEVDSQRKLKSRYAVNLAYRHDFTIFLEATLILLGDFNSVACESDRFDATTGTFTGTVVRDTFDTLPCLELLTELMQDDFTRKGVDAAGHLQYSRIDRIFTSLPSSLLSNLDVRVASPGLAALPRFDLSDHTPVFFTWRQRSSSTRSPIIPSWVPRHPLWGIVLDELRFAQTADKWGDEVEMKRLFHKASSEVKRRAQHHGARTSEEKLWWCLKFLRSVHNGCIQQALSAAGVCSDLQDIPGNCCPSSWTHSVLSQVESFIQRLSQATAEERLQELEDTADLPEFYKSRKRSGLIAWAAQFSPKRRRAGLRGLIDNKGLPITDNTVAHAAVADYWGPVFTAQPVDEQAGKIFLDKYAVQLPRLQWDISFDDFSKLLSGFTDSAPGPDGVPYGAWRHAPEWCQRVLYSALLSWLAGAPLPRDANYAWLALLAKGHDLASGPAGFRTVPDARPLSLGNSDVKILAASINRILEPAVGKWASDPQRGFIKGRQMLDNVIE